ncbi:MAG: DUF2914 domain-containing protein [Proteobacteria bacterium]|nr:DUF2914 domain-containing protein [Pseudomonadota bacterium]
MNRLLFVMTWAGLTAILGLSLAGTGYAGDQLPSLPRPERTQSSNAVSARSSPLISPQPAPAAKETRPSVTQDSLRPSSGPANTVNTATSPTAPQKGQPTPTVGHVTRATFTSAIENREPVDQISQLDDESGQIYFYTELRDMTGETARHRWEFNDRVVAEKAFEVKGPRWRVWSGQPFAPDRPGDWTVSVLNNANEIIARHVLPVAPASGQADSQVAPSSSSAHP